MAMLTMLTGFASRPKTARVFMFVLLALVACIVVLAANPPASTAPDSRQALNRYAEEIRAGYGVVFNPGDRNLLLPAPAYILVLGVSASLLSSLDILVVGQLLFALMLTIGSVAVFDIARRMAFGARAAAALAALYFVAWPMWAGVGSAYPAISALCLVGYVLALDGRWRWAGLVLALATLCGPEALLLAIPLAFLAANQGRALRFGSALGLPLLIVLVRLLLRMYFGPPLWDGMLVLKDQADALSALWPWPLLPPLLALAAWGWFKGRKDAVPVTSAVTATSAAWIALYVLIVAGVLRVDAPWKYAPLAGPVVLTAGIGLRSLQPYSARIIAAMGVALLVLASLLVTLTMTRTIPALLPAQIQSVGFNTVGQVWQTALAPDQSVMTFDGQLQPELKAMLERGDTESALIRYAPDVLFTLNGGRIRAKELANPGVARLDYVGSEQSGIYIRGAGVGAFRDLPVNKPYGPDVYLASMALDQTSLKRGQVLRVRLDWQITRQADKPVIVDLWLRSGEFLVAHTVDTYDAPVFKPDAYSTYHTLKVIESAWSGPVTLEVGIIVNSGSVARYPLAALNIEGP